MTLRYFGTDGIRGPFNGEVINEQFATRLGFALADFVLQLHPQKPITVTIGTDTRSSGILLREAVSRGLCERGIHVVYLGVIPTPGIALAVQQLNADLGIAITASHNPASDNGIKLFNAKGQKFSVETEAQIEALIPETLPPECCSEPCNYQHNGPDHYINYLRSQLHQNCLEGWSVVLDCANGATATTSPRVLKHFNPELVTTGTQPDGTNINAGCGSEHPEALAQLVLRHGAQLGIAHDGDGDRVVLCDERGEVVHGDQLLGLLAAHALSRGALAQKTLVATVQSNLGLDFFMESLGGRVHRVDVGDRNVVRAMQEHGYNLGGEQSGHIVFGDILMSGDGLVSAIKTIEVMLETGKPLSELKQQVPLFPQKLMNVKVAEKKSLEGCSALQAVVQSLEAELGSEGRLLIRYSGTEPKLRLLVEARDPARIEPALARLQQAVRSDLEVL